MEAYASRWLAAQTVDPSTHEAMAVRLRVHVFPHLGSMPLRSVRPSTVQAWMRLLSMTLAPATVRVIFTNVSTVFAAAVDDELIRTNPCRAASVRPPRRAPRRVVPWPAERVAAVRAALPPRYAIVATLAAGLGLRQGEVFGLSPADVDFLRGVVMVRRQVKIVTSRLIFAAPKTKKVRTVPLPTSVRDELSAYLARFPARTVELPESHPDGKRVTVPWCSRRVRASRRTATTSTPSSGSRRSSRLASSRPARTAATRSDTSTRRCCWTPASRSRP